MSNVKTPTSWANRTKTATSAIPIAKSAPRSDRGTRYEGTIVAVTPKAYKTGSFGIEIQYQLNGEERKVYENVVLSKMTDEGTLTPTQYGEATFKRRLQAAGLTADAVNQFPTPRTPKDTQGLDALVGAPVAVYCIAEEYLGKPKKAVRSVFPLESGNGSSAA